MSQATLVKKSYHIATAAASAVSAEITQLLRSEFPNSRLSDLYSKRYVENKRVKLYAMPKSLAYRIFDLLVLKYADRPDIDVSIKADHDRFRKSFSVTIHTED